MWRWNKPAKTLGVGMLLLVVAGCTISIQPWTKPAASTQPHDAPPGNPYAPANFNGPAPRPLPANMGSNNEATSQLIQKYNDANDERNALLNQVQSLRKQLKAGEDNLRQASYEMDETSKQVKRTRDEFRQWQTEMDDLRDRVRKLEDYRAALKPLIEEILHELYREKETPKTLRLQTPGAK